jgi:hypothetical protein
MSNKQESKERPLVVQFFHSGKECPVTGPRDGTSVKVPWSLEKLVRGTASGSTGCASKPVRKKRGGCGGCRNDDGEAVWKSDHSRRLVVHKGDYVDNAGKLVSGDLAFWTEWEACTTACAMPKGAENTDARWFHRVVTPLGKRGNHRVNTDPCVFGSSFKYALCQQHRKDEKRQDSVVLRRLAPGSIILFGSRFLNRNEFVLDTVFVVGDIHVNYVEQTKEKLTVSAAYRELTLNRFSNRSRENTFYRGETFHPPGGSKPYSFVPAKLFVPGDARCGTRFVLNLAAVNKRLRGVSDQFDPNSGQTQGFHVIKCSPETMEAVWKEILDQVVSKQFVPAVHFNWPK